MAKRRRNRRGMIVATLQRKGGNYKTTTTVALGTELEQRGDSVLEVDIDDGANLTDLNLLEDQIERVNDALSSRRLFDHPEAFHDQLAWHIVTEYNALDDDGFERYNREALLRTYRQRSWQPGQGELWVIPGHESLRDVGVALSNRYRANSSLPRPETVLDIALSRARDEFDWILIDTPPADTLETRAALYAADMVVVPLAFGRYQLRAYNRLATRMAQISDLRRQNGKPDVPLGAVIMHKYPSRTYYRDEEKYLKSKQDADDLRVEYRKQFGATLIDFPVPYDETVTEAEDAAVPLQLYAPECDAAVAWAQIITPFLERAEYVAAHR